MAIVEVVKYNGGPDIFAWKYPSEELGTWTQLIVNESQEAILFKGGKALDIFGSGRHTLSTANIPLLNNIVNLPFGGRSPFTAEVWYINKLYSLDVKWGTATPIQIQDPKYQIFCPIRANGTFGIRIEDSKKFLLKLVGNMDVFDKETLVKYFRGVYITKAKDAISSYVIHKKISIMEINAYIDELSVHMQEVLQPVMDEYGIKLVNFYVNDISIPEDDPAVKKLKEALAKKAEMDIIGYNYQQERSFDTLEGAANNNSSGSATFMQTGIGLGMGFGIGGAVKNNFSGVSEVLDTNESIECPKCHTKITKNQRFCGSCGFDIVSANEENHKEKKIVCSQCGNELNPKSKFCSECGKKYNPCPECGEDLKEGVDSCPHCGYEMPKKCPKCGEDIPKNSKFCPECGESLVIKCSNCNATIYDNSKFCPECGQKLKGLNEIE